MFVLIVGAGTQVGCNGIMLPDPNVRVIAFGDSTTAGPSARDYVEDLPELLDRPAVEFANEGRGGETTEEGLARLRRMVGLDIYPNARQIIYWEGGNDVIDFIQRRDPLLIFSPLDANYPFGAALDSQLDATQQQIEQAIAAGAGAGWQVTVATYFPIPSFSVECNGLLFGVIVGAQAEHANVYRSLLNDRIRSAARNGGAVLVDVAALADELTADPGNYFDCNHLSARGNAIVADRLAQALQSAANAP